MSDAFEFLRLKENLTGSGEITEDGSIKMERCQGRSRTEIFLIQSVKWLVDLR